MSIYHKKLYEKFLDEFYDKVELSRSSVQKDSALYDKTLTQLTDLLAGTYDKQRRKAINDAISCLVSVDRVKFTKTDVNKINGIFEDALGIDLQEAVTGGVTNLTSKTYKIGINEIANAVGVKLSFSLADRNAAEILAKQNLFWVGNFYDEQVKETMERIIGGYFADGLTIEDVAAKLEIQFFEKTDKGVSYFEGLAEHVTSRVREMGKITGYEKAGIEYLQVKAIVDDRTSAICLRMNGTLIPVSEAVKLRDKLLAAAKPADVKKITPWYDITDLPDGKDNGSGVDFDKLPAGMAFPPYHFRCRTITIAYFKK